MTTNTAVSQDWTTSPERGNLLMLRFMSWISLRLGRQVARGVLHLIAAYFLLFSPASRRASRGYLYRALAHRGRAPNWRDLYRHFFTFAATVHDRIYLANDRFDLFDLTLHGYDDLERVFGRGQGLFLMGAHLGSFDVVRTTGRHHARMAVTMVMREGNAKMINAVLTAINPGLAQDIIALGHVDSMLKVSERLANGGAIGILADRTPGDEPQQRVTLLADNAYLPVGPFRMAAMLQRPVYFMAGLYLGGNHYAVHFDPIADFTTVTRDQREAAIEAAITRYAALLEQYCREAPYNWFNFFDFWQRPPAAITSRPS